MTPFSLQRALRPKGQRAPPPNRSAMRNRQLHAALAAFAEEAAWQLAADASEGAEVPFEVVASGRRDSPLYCYRPLTADFITQRVSLLGRLPSYLPALRALAECGGVRAHPRSRGAAAPRGRPARARTGRRAV